MRRDRGAQRGEAVEQSLHQAAIGGEVVAGNDREGADIGGAAAGERLYDQTRNRTRRARRFEVAADVGMRLVQSAGRGVVAIALLGDGERHDPDTRGSVIVASRRSRSSAATRISRTLPMTRRRSPSPERTASA